MNLSTLTRWLPIGRVPEIKAKALQEALADSNPPRILDVRSNAEWQKSRITGAVNIPITELGSRIGELPFDRNDPIVAICLSAHRSIPAVRLLKQNGYGNVRQLRGGMLSWWAGKLSTTGERRLAVSGSRALRRSRP